MFSAFLRRPDGTFATWSVPGECDAAPATGFWALGGFQHQSVWKAAAGYEDNSGNFVGHGLFRSPDGKLTTFDVPGAGTGRPRHRLPGSSRPLNLFGAIAGFYIDGNNVVHGYLRSPAGEITTFDVRRGPPRLGLFRRLFHGPQRLGGDHGILLGRE